ncbi:MAG: hypothetical protein AB7I41_14590 [Candidatus Sericytochromatia bacterium]
MQLDPQRRNTAPAATTRTVATRAAAAPPAPPKSAPTPVPRQDQHTLSAPSGRAAAAVSLSSPTPQAGVMLLGLKQGDKLDFDGIASANGSGQIKKMDGKNLEIQAEINIPGLVRGLADDYFGLRNGKIDLSIKLTQDSKGQWQYQLHDNVSNKGAGSGKSNVQVNETFQRGTRVQTITASTPNGDLVIRISQNAQGKLSGSLTIPGIPKMVSGFDFSKS